MINPVVLVFAFNRPLHLYRTLEALSSNHQIASLPVRVIVDGPRSDHDTRLVSRVVQIASAKRAYGTPDVVQSQTNFGCSLSIENGVTQAMQEYDSCIVIEDDILISPWCISFFIDALTCYKHSSDVGCISAYTPPIGSGLPSTFFLRGADCWGWATWRDRWELYNNKSDTLLSQLALSGQTNEFNIDNNYPYSLMLRENPVWDLCWHASLFLANKLTLYPSVSLVENIGLDGTGDRCNSQTNIFHTSAVDTKIDVNPLLPVVDPTVYKLYVKLFSTTQSLPSRFSYYLQKYKIKPFIRALLPVFFQSRLRLVGSYSSFEAALNDSSGYDSPEILDRVKRATVEVLEGAAEYERDGTAFALRPKGLKIRSLLKSLLSPGDHIIDFGGSLGQLYINHRDLLDDCTITVVEQPNFVATGRELAATYNIPCIFSENLEQAGSHIKVVIFSSVLQYIPEPYLILKEAGSLRASYILIDRTAFGLGTRYKRQVVQSYYSQDISYPHRSINKSRLLKTLPNYAIVQQWVNEFDPIAPYHGGMLLELKQ